MSPVRVVVVKALHPSTTRCPYLEAVPSQYWAQAVLYPSEDHSWSGHLLQQHKSQSEAHQSQRANKPVSQRADEPTSRRANEPMSRWADEPTSRQANEPMRPELTETRAQRPEPRDKNPEVRWSKEVTWLSRKEESGHWIREGSVQYSFHHFYLQYERFWVVLRRLSRLRFRGSYAYRRHT